VVQGEALVEPADDGDQPTPHVKRQRETGSALAQGLDAVPGDARGAGGLLGPLEIGGCVPDGDVPDTPGQLGLLEPDAAALPERRLRQPLDGLDRIDGPRPAFDVAEDVPDALLRRIDVDGSLELHVEKSRGAENRSGWRAVVVARFPDMAHLDTVPPQPLPPPSEPSQGPAAPSPLKPPALPSLDWYTEQIETREVRKARERADRAAGRADRAARRVREAQERAAGKRSGAQQLVDAVGDAATAALTV